MNEQQAIDPYVVNGKRYSLWPQFVERKHEWIGGALIDLEYPNDPTEITDIRFEPNGETSAAFFVDGQEFGCGADVSCLAVDPDIGGDGWLGFRGYGGHRWKIKKP